MNVVLGSGACAARPERRPYACALTRTSAPLERWSDRQLQGLPRVS